MKQFGKMNGEVIWLICNNFNSPDIDNVLKEYENLKMELQSIYDQKGKAAIDRFHVTSSLSKI